MTGAISEGVAGRLIINSEASNGYRGLEREWLEFLPSIAFALSDNRTLLLDFDYRKSLLTPDTYGIAFNFQRQLADVSAETRYSTPFSNVD